MHSGTWSCPCMSPCRPFDLIMGKTLPVFDYDLSQCLAEWRCNGALAGTLTAVVLDARKRANKGKVFQHPTKGSKGVPHPGKGEGELKRERDRDQQTGKGNRSIKGKMAPPPPPASLPSRASSQGASSSSGHFNWRPTLSSTSSSTRNTQDSSPPSRQWQ